MRLVLGWRGCAALAVFVGGSSAAMLPACDADEAESSSLDASVDGAGVVEGNDAGFADASDAGQPGTAFRVAHLSPDLGPVDICYRASPSDGFTGPLLGLRDSRDAGADVEDAARAVDAGDAGDSGGVEDAGDAGDAGDDAGGAGASNAIHFGSASAYYPVAISGSLELAVVAASDRTCSTPRARKRLALPPGQRTTLALVGRFQADAGDLTSLDIQPYADDTTRASGSARSRFVNAALGSLRVGPLGPVSVTAVDEATVVPLAARVEPGRFASPSPNAPTIDALGYHEGRPLASGLIRVQRLEDAGSDSGARTWDSQRFALDLASGTSHTGVLAHDAVGRLVLLWCADHLPVPTCTLVRGSAQ